MPITNSQTGTRIDPVEDGIFKIHTPIREVPGGFSFNQYLVVDDEPLVFHTGPRRLFPRVRQAIATVLPIEKLRWVAFSHVEADESGAINEFLAAAPHARPVCSMVAAMVSMNDHADALQRGPVHAGRRRPPGDHGRGHPRPKRGLPKGHGLLLARQQCTSVQERLHSLGEAVRELVGAGKVRFAAPAPLLQRLDEAGLIARTYRVPAGGSVACGVGPTDVYQATHLEADLTGVERVDLVKTLPGGVTIRQQDVPFDVVRGVVRVIERGNFLRTLPSLRMVIELVSVTEAGERALGRYLFEHTALGR